MTQAMKIKAGLALERGQHKVLNKVYAFYWRWQSPTIYTGKNCPQVNIKFYKAFQEHER